MCNLRFRAPLHYTVLHVFARLTGTKTISQVFGYARENVDMKALADETKSWLLDWFNIPSAQAEDRVTVMTLSSIIEQMNATLMSFQVLVTATASISLLVGGIGIMNMMLTNVDGAYWGDWPA